MRSGAMWIGVSVLAVASLGAAAQSKAQKQTQQYDKAARATVLHDALVYVASDAESQRLSEVTPGHEVVVVERNGPWVKVFANTDVNDDAGQDEWDKPEFGDDKQETQVASGWIRDKGVLGPTTPNGDLILYGTAVEFQSQAEQPHSPKGAAQAAELLYRRVTEYFPQSQLAPEAAWRSADIRWQLAKQDVSTLPSAKEQEAYLRPQIYDGEMKKIIKNYPGSKFAAQAAYEMLDNKLCGDWQGLPKCPEMEAKLYEKYAEQYPDGPRAAEALYNALYRQGVAVTMYGVQDDKKRADDAAQHTQALAQMLQQRYPTSEYAARGASVAYRVAQGIPIYGSDRD